MPRRGLTESEILIELHGDESGEEFSDFEDEFEDIYAVVQQELERLELGEVEDAEGILQRISEMGMGFSFWIQFEN